MKYELYINGDRKATLPGNLNKESFLDIIRIYMFNDEFADWDRFLIKRCE